MNLLEVEALSKRYRDRIAVDDVSFSIQEGDVYGLLGPNGAGKSTLLRMVMGLIRPTGGRVLFHGEQMTAAHRGRIGAAIEYPSFYSYLSARDNVRMLAGVSGRPASLQAIDQAIERVGLAARSRDATKHFSQGMKQRLAIALALVAQPALLILDEPTNGLDPHGIRELRELILDLPRTEGITVFISSHLLSEVAITCNRALVMNRGKRIWEGSVPELLDDQSNYLLKTSNGIAPQVVLDVAAGLQVAAKSTEEGWLLHGVSDPAALIRAMVQAEVPVISFAAKPVELEELFFRWVGEEVRPS